jgi:hypothetical protein
MAKAHKEVKLIRERFDEVLEGYIRDLKQEKVSTDDINLDEELGQLLADVIEEVKERDWERSF